MDNNYNAICILSWFTLLILSVLIHENARIPVNEKKNFYLTYILVAVALFGEWAGLYLNGCEDRLVPLLKSAKCVDYVCTPAVTGVLVGQLKIRSKLNKAIASFIVFNAVFQIISAFNGWVYYITDDNRYEEGPLYPEYLAVSVAVILMAAVLFVQYGRNYRRQNQVSLYLILAFVLTSIAMQEIIPWEARTLYIGISIAMVLLFIHVTEYSQLATDDYLTEQLIKINTDALTGLYSRHAYSQALKDYNAMETLPESFAAFSIDINGLKRVNDRLGHEAGDELIQGAADCIDGVFSPYGNCYRTGGDEFIILANLSRTEADKTVRQLDDLSSKWSGERVDAMHLAVGYALAEDHSELNAEKLVNEADLLMYDKKIAYYQSEKLEHR